MFTVKILALELGILLVYAGVKGLSVAGLLRGDNQQKTANKPLTTGIKQQPAAPVSGYAQSSGANLH